MLLILAENTALKLSLIGTIIKGQEHVCIEIKVFPSLPVTLASISAGGLLEQIIHLLSVEAFWNPQLQNVGSELLLCLGI